MKNITTNLQIKIPYWLGILADAIWAIALLHPPIYGLLTGDSDFNPDLHYRLTMSIGGVLMLGWTILLIWAVQRPIQRRCVSLITAFPVVFGMMIVSIIGYISGDSGSLWIVFKTAFLFILMMNSYLISRKIALKNKI